jgi:hypothetical protein
MRAGQAQPSPAGLETGDTAGLETCATPSEAERFMGREQVWRTMELSMSLKMVGEKSPPSPRPSPPGEGEVVPASGKKTAIGSWEQCAHGILFNEKQDSKAAARYAQNGASFIRRFFLFTFSPKVVG